MWFMVLQTFKDKCKNKGQTTQEYIGRQTIGIIFSRLVYFVIAVIVYFVDPARISKLFPPAVVGSTVSF